MANFAALLYLAAGVLFVFALRGLSAADSARQGARYGMAGMAVAIFAAFAYGGPSGISGWLLTIVGIALGGGGGASLARRIEMTRMPQFVALFHALVGLAVVLVAAGALYAPHAFGIAAPGAIPRSTLLEIALGAVIGAIAGAGSAIAAVKLDDRFPAIMVRQPQRQKLNLVLAGLLALLLIAFVTSESHFAFFLLVLVALATGAALIAPIGLADLPVVGSILNSCSGWAIACVGFALGNLALIIVGALVGASGATLTRFLSKATNRSLVSIARDAAGVENDAVETRPVRRGSAEDAAYIMQHASSVVIVPGAGMAAAQAQDAVRELVDRLGKAGVAVRYAIHPAAGRAPGQLNALLAQPAAPDALQEIEDVNAKLAETDVAFVIGANDVANPAAAAGPKSPLHGLPTLDVEKARTVVLIKRGMGPGYAGVENELFFNDNTMMLFGEAKTVTETIVKAMGR